METYLYWLLGSFAIGFFANSFIEWIVHRFIMHKPWIHYGYLHVTSHHTFFGWDASYESDPWDAEMIEHGVAFTWREYVLFGGFCLLAYGALEWVTGAPVAAGAMLSVVANLLMFDLLHHAYHVPKDWWFQRTYFFRFLKEHHRIHHEDMTKNFNVSFLPVADFCLGTLRRS